MPDTGYELATNWAILMMSNCQLLSLLWNAVYSQSMKLDFEDCVLS